MAIRLFNLKIEDFGSGLCAVTSVALIVTALWALLKVSEIAVSKLMMLF
jgi:hypothetical protein